MLQHRTATHSNFSQLHVAKIGSGLVLLLCLRLTALDSSQPPVSRETPHSQKKLTKQIFPNTLRLFLWLPQRGRAAVTHPFRPARLPALGPRSPLQPEHPSPPGAPAVLGAPGTAEPLPATRPTNKGALPPPEPATRPGAQPEEAFWASQAGRVKCTFWTRSPSPAYA